MSTELDENCCEAFSFSTKSTITKLFNNKSSNESYLNESYLNESYLNESSIHKSTTMNKSTKSSSVNKSIKFTSDYKMGLPAQSIGLCSNSSNCNLINSPDRVHLSSSFNHSSSNHPSTKSNCSIHCCSNCTNCALSLNCTSNETNLTSPKFNLSECSCTRPCSIQNSKSSFKCASRSSAIDDRLYFNDDSLEMNLSITKLTVSSNSSSSSFNNSSSNNSSSNNSSIPSYLDYSSSFNKSTNLIKSFLTSFSKRCIHLPCNYQTLLVPLLLVLCTVIRISGKS